MAYIDDIVKFHSFSKSTVRTGLTLGEAVNPSGHTVTSKQVRTDDIPWFVNSFQGDEAKARTWAASNATAARHNDILYYGAEFKVGFTAPKCLIYVSKQEVDGKLVDLPAEQCGWQTFDLNSATTLKNADGKDVIAIHKNSKVEYVDGNNNAATNSNQQSLFVRRADGTLLDHFVAATDQIVGGQPSLGYSAVVSVGGKAIDEGEGSGNYIGNTYAGIIHFHSARTQTKAADGSVNGITVTCFEYIGDKLDTALGNIDGKIQDIVGTTMEGVVASVGTTTAASTVGISVDSSTKTSPKINITTGTVGGASDAKLVTGATVKTYVDSATAKATVTDGVITTGDEAKLISAGDAKSVADKAASDAITEAVADGSVIDTRIDEVLTAATLPSTETIANATDTSKLVTVEDVTTYVNENAKVTLTQGTGITVTPNATASTAFTIAVDDTVATKTYAEGQGTAAQTAVKETAISTTSTGGSKVTVTLGGTVANPTLSVTESDIASAAALATLEQTVTDHITNAGGKLEISVPEGGTLPTTGEVGKIYLIPNNGNEEQNIYDEFVWTNGAWEKIGSTKVDLTDYVTNSSLTTTLSGYVTTDEKTTLEGSIAEAKTAAQTAQTTADSKVAQTDYDAKVAELEEAISTAAPSDYIKTVTVGSTTTSGETALTIKDGRDTVYANDLWGTTVSIDNNTITVQGGPIDGSAWGPKNGYNTKGSVYVDGTSYPQSSNPITKVENNMVYNGTTEVANIKTDELVNGSYMFSSTSLASFNGDLSSLVNGYNMFFDTSLESFSGDLSSLVNGYNMFSYTSLASFSGDLSSLVNGSYMFSNTSLKSFSGDLSSLVNGFNMFSNTSLESFSGDLSSLVNGTSMFSNTSLESFSGDLSSLVNGSYMFYNTSLESFSGDLSSLVNGSYMFYNTSLDVESVELICDVLPNYNTENGGQQLQTCTWDGKKYTYTDWSSGTYYYPIIEISNNWDSMSSGNADGIDRTFSRGSIYQSEVKTISIYWKDISVLSTEDRTAITQLFSDTANEKGWTFITNSELGGTVSPNAVMTTDGTIQYYVLAKKDEATEDDATHIDANGKLWKFDTAEAIIGPNVVYWSMFATVEDALTEWELTPYVKPTEEETQD